MADSFVRMSRRPPKPQLVDTFCKAGGATRGYQRAGFYVVGVDIEPQPNYCGDEFIQADALELLADHGFLSRFDAVHASPICKKWTAYRRRPEHVPEYPDLIGPTRELLEQSGRPWVIENIPGAPLRPDIQLCGSPFGLDVQRHRWFETNVPGIMSPPCVHGIWKPRFAHATNRTNLRRTVEIGVYRIPLPVQQQAMGIGWMTLSELSQAIPPAYTEYIGAQLREHLQEGTVNQGNQYG
jgi:DNA (cytosine-5)-methyltransferase 1